jgi:hypothetical protein
MDEAKYMLAAGVIAVKSCTNRLVEIGWTVDEIQEHRPRVARVLAEMSQSEVLAVYERLKNGEVPEEDEFTRVFEACGVAAADQIGGAE